MNKNLEGLTTSVLIYPTATTDKTGSASVDMANYTSVIAKLCAPRLPDGKGDNSVVTLSIYENSVGLSSTTGSLVTDSIVTDSISSVSDVYLETELKDMELSKNGDFRYITPHVAIGTSNYVAVTIDRANGRYEPQS